METTVAAQDGMKEVARTMLVMRNSGHGSLPSSTEPPPKSQSSNPDSATHTQRGVTVCCVCGKTVQIGRGNRFLNNVEYNHGTEEERHMVQCLEKHCRAEHPDEFICNVIPFTTGRRTWAYALDGMVYRSLMLAVRVYPFSATCNGHATTKLPEIPQQQLLADWCALTNKRIGCAKGVVLFGSVQWCERHALGHAYLSRCAEERLDKFYSCVVHHLCSQLVNALSAFGLMRCINRYELLFRELSRYRYLLPEDEVNCCNDFLRTRHQISQVDLNITPGTQL